MTTIEELVAKARDSALFTAPTLGRDLETFLKKNHSRLKQLAEKAVQKNNLHIYWIGSGNSWANLYSGKYLLDRFTTISSDCLTSYELITRSPGRLNKDSWVFAASYSGSTEDTVNALRYAKSKGAYTISITNKEGTIMGKEANETFEYNSNALYILPLAAAYLFALEAARTIGNSEAKSIIDSLYSVPPLLTQQYVDEEDHAKHLAEKYAEESNFYVLGTGVLYGLAYKFGPTVIMENMRVHGAFIDGPEFRHGPVEMLDRQRATIILLKDMNTTRPMMDRVQAAAEEGGADVIIYDAARFPHIHPILAPFVLMIPLQWFAVYSALVRGISDLDERAFMGRNILGKGEGITWP